MSSEPRLAASTRYRNVLPLTTPSFMRWKKNKKKRCKTPVTSTDPQRNKMEVGKTAEAKCRTAGVSRAPDIVERAASCPPQTLNRALRSRVEVTFHSGDQTFQCFFVVIKVPVTAKFRVVHPAGFQIRNFKRPRSTSVLFSGDKHVPATCFQDRFRGSKALRVSSACAEGDVNWEHDSVRNKIHR